MKSLVKLVVVGSLVVVSAVGEEIKLYYLEYGSNQSKEGHKIERNKIEEISVVGKDMLRVDRTVIYQSKNPCLMLPADYIDRVKIIDKNTVSFTASNSPTEFSDVERYDFGANLLIKPSGAMVDKEEDTKVIQVLGSSPECRDHPTEETWTLYKKGTEIGKVKFYLK